MREMLDKLTSQFRQLGFGFALGCGLGGILFIVLHAIFPTLQIIPSLFLYSGGALGFAFNKIFDRLYKFLIYPVTRTLRFYTNLLQIFVLKKTKVIDEAKAKLLAQALVDDYFLRNIPNLKQIENLQSVKAIDAQTSANQNQ